MVSSRVYPGLERKPGGPDNWVEAAGGLPSYIERIAKHLHYERGMTISHAIATAVNTVKRWARQGKVVKYRDPNNKRVTTITAAQAAKAVAEWEAKKRAGAARGSRAKISLSSSSQEAVVSDVQALMERARSIQDPEQKARVRARILDLSNTAVVDLATTKDGRKSYKNRGKWRHGFIPVDREAKVAKAKGSPIAMRRINRLFGGASQKDKTVKPGQAIGVKSKVGTGTERVGDVGQSLRLKPKPSNVTQKVVAKQVEESRGRRPDKRSEKPWEDIPEEQKTVRNGKRYVLTTYRGRQFLTEYTGPSEKIDVEAPDPRDKVMSNITPADLKKLTMAALRRMLAMPNVPDHVREMLNRELTRRKKLQVVGGRS